MKNIQLLLCCVAPACLISNSAFAQDAAASEDQQNGEIVVTAQREASLLSKTPIAMTAATAETLRDNGITNPTTLADVVPNLSIDRTNGLQITIRGVSSKDGSEKGDPSAAFMQDGIYIARSQAQEVSFFDIERVEVLRGPQGTLFGRNTTGGVINVISAPPKLDSFAASVDGAYGNLNTRQLTAMLNVPVGNSVAIRGAVNYDRRDTAVIVGPNLSVRSNPYKENLSTRLAALFDLGDGKLVIRGDYNDIGGNTLNSVATKNFYTEVGRGIDPLYTANGKSNTALRTVNPTVPFTGRAGRNNTVWGVMADFQYDLGPVSVYYLGSYRKLIRNEDSPLLIGNGIFYARSRWDAEYSQNSHELRIATSGEGPLKLQAGAYFFNEQSDVNFTIFGLVSPVPNTVGYVYGFLLPDTKVRSLAGFAQATYSLTDRLRVTAGARYSRDKKSRIGQTIVCATLACTGPGDSKATQGAARTFSKPTWRFGVEYDLNPRSLLYASVSTGYKAGGFNDGCSASTPGCITPQLDDRLSYDPESITAYEAGIKTRLLGDALRLQLAAFHYDYKDLQVAQVTTCPSFSGQLNPPPCGLTQNAASAKIDGVELEATIQPSPNDRFDFNVNWLDARYGNFVAQVLANGVTFSADFKNRKLDRSPEWTVSAGYSHTFDFDQAGNLVAAVRTHLSDEYYIAALENLNQFRQPSFTKTDATLTYNSASGDWYVQGFVKNIENTITVSVAFAGALSSVQFADPRTYGIRAGFKF